MVHILKAEIINDYNISIEFNNGTKGTINFKNIFEDDHREIVKELLDKDLFKTVKINLNTLCWDNTVDFAPDYLIEKIE